MVNTWCPDPNKRVHKYDDGTMGGENSTSTAVHVAARNGNVRELRFLLAAAGADPNIDGGSNSGSSSGKRTPCYGACSRHHHDCVRVLLALGATPDHSTRTGDGLKCTCPGDIAHASGCKCVQCE